MSAPDTDASLLDGYDTEWRLLSERPHNVLIEGTVGATEAVLRRLRRHVREPIAWHLPPAMLDVPTGETRTFVVRDVAALNRQEQRRLLEWACAAGARTQLVTTAACALFGLVVAGRFDAALYYRLNVLLLRVAPPLSSQSP
jgi:sigma-54-interacting transcriptional regulator